MKAKEEEQDLKTGRRTIDDPKRDRTFSKRAKSGKIIVEEGFCPKCKHNKVITNMSASSPLFGISKCAKCKRVLQ
jgi:hypothetical protein